MSKRYAVIDDEDDESDEPTAVPAFSRCSAERHRIAERVAGDLSGKMDKDMRWTKN